MADDKRWGQDILTNEVRGNFMWIHKVDPGKDKIKGGKYSATILIRKDDREGLAIIKDSIKEVGQVDNLADLNKHPLINNKGVVKDGDSEKNKKYEGYPGHLYFKSISERQPEVFILNEDGSLNRLREYSDIEREIYNGAYYRFILTPHYYELLEDGEVSSCVTFFLKGVLKVRDGKKLGGGSDPEQIFLTALNANNPLAKKKAASVQEVEEVEDIELEIEEVKEEIIETKKVETATTPPKKRGRKNASVTSLLD